MALVSQLCIYKTDNLKKHMQIEQVLLVIVLIIVFLEVVRALIYCCWTSPKSNIIHPSFEA